MAFTQATLTLVSSSGPPYVWTYHTADSIATVDGSGYFTNVADFWPGDIVHVVVHTSAANIGKRTAVPTDYGILVCVTGDGVVVNMSTDQLAGTFTKGD